MTECISEGGIPNNFSLIEIRWRQVEGTIPPRGACPCWNMWPVSTTREHRLCWCRSERSEREEDGTSDHCGARSVQPAERRRGGHCQTADSRVPRVGGVPLPISRRARTTASTPSLSWTVHLSQISSRLTLFSSELRILRSFVGLHLDLWCPKGRFI